MGQQIIRQPDGLYAVWSTIVDDFVLRDANTDTLVSFMTEEAISKLVDQVWKIINDLEHGRRPYYQFTLSWEAARQILADKHGKVPEDQ